MIPQIHNLASNIDAEWCRTGRADADFSKVATELLAKPLDLDFEKLVHNMCGNEALPEQRRLDQGFGQPAVTLYNDDKFTIEALIWYRSTPAIHEHAFSGAFRILTGSSLHSRYVYSGERQVGFLSLGRLELQLVEILESGSTRAIPAGSGLIHANFHLEAPTLTLVVRTHQVSERELTYLPPGIAYDPARRTPASHKLMQLLDTLHQIKYLHYFECVDTAIRNSDLYDGIAIVMRAGAHLDDSSYQQLTHLLRDVHGADTECIIRSLNEERRRSQIMRLLTNVVDPDLRFFLACLLTFSTRKPVLDTMILRYGSASVARNRIYVAVGEILGGDRDRQQVLALAAQAILDDVRDEGFPKWAESLWGRTLSSKESDILKKHYQFISRHPLLSPLVY